MINYGLGTLVLVLMLVASFLGGIFVGEIRGKNSVDSSAHVETVLIGSFHKNGFVRYSQLLRDGEISQEKYNEFVMRSLLDNIVYLFLNEKFATDTEVHHTDHVKARTDQPERTLIQAGSSMDLLGLQNSSDFNDLFQADDRKIDWYDESLFDTEGQITSSFADFVDRSVEKFQSIKGPSE